MATDTLIKPQTVRYWSMSDNYGIPRVEPDEVVQPNGKLVVRNRNDYERYYVQFRNNQLEVKVGQDVLPTGPDGEQEDVVAFLERHPRFGIMFHRVDDQAPPADSAHDLIQGLLLDGDLDGLGALAETEMANWARPEVQHALVKGLQRLHDRAEGDPERQTAIRATFDHMTGKLGVEVPEPSQEG